MTRPCPKCAAPDQEGEDLGDHPAWLEFECEACGHAWGQDVSEDLADEMDAAFEAQVDDRIMEQKEKEGKE